MFAGGNMSAESATQFVQRLEGQLRERCAAQPPFTSQLNEQRVVCLAPGRPALLTQPGPNPANDNSAAVVSFQASSHSWRLATAASWPPLVSLSQQLLQSPLPCLPACPATS